MTLGLGFGLARRHKKGVASVALPAAPSGSKYATAYSAASETPYWLGGPDVYAWGRRWNLDSARQAHSLTCTDPTAQILRFHIKQTDPLFSKTNPTFSDTNAHRNKLVLREADWFGPTFSFRATGKIKIVDGTPTTTAFWTFHELHTFGSAFMLAAMFELFNRQGKFGVSANYNPTSSSTATRTLWDYQTPGLNGTLDCVEGQTYDVDYFVKPDPTGTTGRVWVKINGVVYVNFTGKVGFINTTQVAPELGEYRGPNTVVEDGIVEQGPWVFNWGVGLTDPSPP